MDICLDACCQAALAEGLGDDVAAWHVVVVTLQHYVDEVVLDEVEPQGHDVIGVFDVADAVFGGGPVCKIELLAELGESLPGVLYGRAVEDRQWGFPVTETLNLGVLSHHEWEEKGSVRYGAYVEAEAEAGCETAVVWIVGVLHVLFLGAKIIWELRIQALSIAFVEFFLFLRGG